jgi:hypothetical protein
MKLKEIDQSVKSKKQYSNPIIDLLLTEEPSTKEELMAKLNCSDRSLRNVISVCSMYYPVIATSDRAGYRRAKNIDNLEGEALDKELEEVIHQINEIKSRIACLKKKLKPLIAWQKVAEKKKAGNL